MLLLLLAVNGHPGYQMNEHTGNEPEIVCERKEIIIPVIFLPSVFFLKYFERSCKVHSGVILRHIF